MEYDAIADCAGADAWTCVARAVEEASYRRKAAAGLRRAGWDGGVGEDSGGGGGGDDLFEEGVEVEGEALELTLMRCGADSSFANTCSPSLLHLFM